jgi:outer membrane receptor protein involved in Fe transport
MKSKLYHFLALTMFLPYILLGSTQGKIRGKVVDSQTGEPLIGAAVIVVGTPYGGTTNVDGEFQVLKLEVGTYQLKCSYIGYQTITQTNIRVNADLTTEADFKLPPQGVAVPTVLVVAERPLINKSATGAVRIIDNDFITALPTRGIENAVKLQPGVVIKGTDVFIRGSRADETGFIVDGVPVTNRLAGGRGITLSSEMVEQIQVQAGGYSAEYGNADGGLVISQLRTGGDQLKATLTAETDNFTKQSTKALGGYSYGYSDYIGTVGGPIPGTNGKLRFFGSFENSFARDNDQRVWDGADVTGVTTAATFSVNHPYSLGVDTLNFLYPAGNRLGGGLASNTAVATAVYNGGDFQLRASGSYTKQQQRTSLGMTSIFDQARLPLTTRKNGFGSLKLTHFVTPTINYEASAYFSQRNFGIQDPYLLDNLNAYGDTTANLALGFRIKQEGTNFTPWALFGGDMTATQPGQVIVGGTDRGRAAYDRQVEQKMGGRLDFSIQQENHSIKVGGEFNTYLYRRYSPGGLLNRATLMNDPTKTLAEKAGLLRGQNGGLDNYGYDVFGNEISSDVVDPVTHNITDLGPRKPVEIAGYVQDKIELTDININIGVRYDYIKSGGITLVNPKKSGFDDANNVVADSSYKESDANQYVSPRIGFSFPVTDRTVFHAQYNKLVAQTKYRDSYLGLGRAYGILKGGTFYDGNYVSGFGLRPERTTQYEIGFSQQISDAASFDITTFYRDIQDQIQYGVITPQADANQQYYYTLLNGDYSTTKGLEFRLTMRRTNRIQAQFSYTYSDARGTGSNPNSLAGAVGVAGSAAFTPKFVFPVDFDQAHTGNISVDYRYGMDEGGPVLSRAGFNLLMTFASGSSFTRLIDNSPPAQSDPRARTPIELIGASTGPWTYRFDLRIDKTVTIGPLEANFYIYVQNLLNTLNATAVFPRTGSASDDGYLATTNGITTLANYGPQYEQLYNAYYTGNNSGNYDIPRMIRFGVKLEY